MSFELKKPYSEKERVEFIVFHNHKNGLEIVRTENAIYALEEDEIMKNGVPVKDINFAYKKKLEEKERIGMLKMTPLDFIKALETVGVPYSTIKRLCDENEEVDKQLRFCNMVYRGNELLDNLCGQFGITSEQLDSLFEEKGS